MENFVIQSQGGVEKANQVTQNILIWMQENTSSQQVVELMKRAYHTGNIGGSIWLEGYIHKICHKM
jgi:hypothetical protein